MTASHQFSFLTHTFFTDSLVVASISNPNWPDQLLEDAGSSSIIAGHQLAIDNVQEGSAAGNDNVLIPVVLLHQFAERRAIADRSHPTY